jgi:PKD repeat protein
VDVRARCANAGADQTITLPAGVSLDGTVTDDGKPTNTVTTAWTQTVGPGTTTFANPNAVDTTATFSAAGTYTLQLTANDTALTGSDTVQVTVAPAPPAGSGTVEQRISVGSDDAEESATGSYAGSSTEP